MVLKKNWLHIGTRIVAGIMTAVLVLQAAPCMDVQAKDYAIQQEVPDLKDVLTAEFGDDFIVGGAICQNEISDKNLMALVTKHMNAITFGNELKPDAIFNYSNNRCPGTQEVELNGETIVVPVTNFDRAENMLKFFVDWNAQHPDEKIRIRGHVLTWHSQTPEWFFHEDYDASKPYVDKDTMTKRHEWYIKTVLEHFVGEDSPYKDMFYGWDVVNEAVSDNRGTYRNDQENSSWWAVYQSEEYIINAFRFANKYAPASLELYYNDYGDSSATKSKGICQLLSDVKNAEGTRIDAMGMQGHYNTESNPSVSDFKKAATAYAQIVGKVQLTELDFQCSSKYDGTADTYDEENLRLALRYLEFYQAMQELNESGVHVAGMTVWGMIDKNSWLQHASFVGGGANGSKKQMPLLFDDDYQVKQAYWAFVDQSKLSYPIKYFSIYEAQNFEEDETCFDKGEKITFTGQKAEVSFIPVWSTHGFKVKVSVKDATADDTDEISLYCLQNDVIQKQTISRKDATQTKDGYEVVFEQVGDDTLFYATAFVKMDLVVTDAKEQIAYSDKALNQENSSEKYAIATLKPLITIPKGTAQVDGQMEDIWLTSKETPLTVRIGETSLVAANARLLWDEENLYVYFKVQDPELNADNQEEHQKDSIEIFIDEKNQKSSSYQADDKQYRINYLNEQSFNGENCKAEYITSFAEKTSNGYIVEAAIKWTILKPYYNMKIGLDLQVNNASKDGVRIGMLKWADAADTGYMDTSVFGTAILGRESTQTYESQDMSAEGTIGGIHSAEAPHYSWFQKLIMRIKRLFGF